MFKNSVEKITRSLSRMVEQLEAHAAHQDKQIEFHVTKSVEHDGHAAAARREANHARTVAHKVRGLVG